VLLLVLFECRDTTLFATMKFPVAIHKDEGSDYGVSVPDFSGCHSSGDTIERALTNSIVAIELWVESTVESGGTVTFKASTIEALRATPEYEGAIWALVDIDPAQFDATPEHVSISLPRFVLAQIDQHAETRRETRSGFLLRAALNAINGDAAHHA